MKIALIILGTIVTLACNVVAAHAQEADVTMAAGVSVSVLNGTFSASSYSTAEDCLGGDLGACAQVLAETALSVEDSDLANSMMESARNIFN
jgi:hypothetical protein